MRTLIATVIVAASLAACADQWETVERPTSGDRVILNDTEYVLMSADDFAAFTNKLAVLVSIARKQWNLQHRSEDGRRAWHGSKTSTTVTTNEFGRMVKVIEYADGYRHVEESEIRKPQAKAAPAAAKARTTDIPLRKRKVMQGVDFVREVK